MTEKELKLKVAEAIQDDVNKGIVRIDSGYLAEVDIKPGDIVEIEGERKTVAIADRSYPGDIGLNIIRMDGIIRKNGKTGIGEIVKVRKALVKEAKKVIIAPARKGIVIRASPEIFKQGLLGRAVVKGDIVSLGGAKRRKSTMMGNPFFDEDIFSILDESMMGIGFGDIKFVVVDTNPKAAVIILDSTEIEFRSEAVEIEEERVPDISYEDVGGLEDEIKKVREMVELPLKHPEIFERLGIEAPKGVLLHGPPGTGKTLLAKAVANETNSHFILINGPEVMSKYYGQSLPYDEKVLIMVDNKLEMMSIGEIVENNFKNIKVPCFNSEGKIILNEVSSLIKHKFRGRLTKITTSSGRTITVTDDHSLFTKVNNKIESVKTSALKEGISFVAIPKLFIERNGFEEEYLSGKEQALLQIGKNLLGTFVDWDKVVKLEYLNNKPEFVYDLSVPGCENFIAGFGGIFAHNSEENLRKKFEEAEKNAPSIIFIDEVDAIASKREETRGEVERRVVAQLLALMDGLQSRGKVVVIAASNVPNILDPALRRPGRFDREIEIGVPSKEGRLNILKIHTRNMPMYTKENLVKESGFEPEYKEAILNLLRYKDANSRSLERTISKYLVDNPEKNELFKKIEISKLKRCMEKINYDSKIVHLKELAEITHGFVGADLSSLAKEAAMIVLRKVLPDIKLKEDEPLPKELLEKLVITQQDFKEALKVVRPSALREVLVEIPNVKWNDIGGLENIKQELVEAVEWPLKYPEAFKRLGVRPPRGILLYGAPGSGKTLLAKAVANESEANFISVKGPELLSMYVGESEKAVRQIFKKARQVSPCIIFFDEVDALAPRRGVSSDSHVSERVVNQLLTEIDGLEDLHDVVVISATNRPDIVDTALLRPGRFDRMILTPIPEEKSRFEIFKVHTKGMPISVEISAEKLKGKKMIAAKTKEGTAVEYEEERSIFNLNQIKTKDDLLMQLAKKTEGYVGADIEAVCREAAIFALREDISSRDILPRHLEKALDKVRPSVTKDVEKYYEELQEQLTAARAKQMLDEKPAYMG